MASSRRVDGVERAVLCLYYREDAVAIASCHDALIQLDVQGRGSATVIGADGYAIVVPGLGSCT